MDDGRPELRVEVDRERASLYGLSTNDVGFVVRGAINGLEAAKYRTGNDEYDIVVRLREEVEGVLADFAAALPPGYAMAFTGEQEDQQEAQEFLVTAFMIALMLIALILVTQFNSVVKPVIIPSSVIMSTIGVLVGLLDFQMPFVIIMTGVGVISLAGIVVNNAIVLIDYIDVCSGIGTEWIAARP